MKFNRIFVNPILKNNPVYTFITKSDFSGFTVFARVYENKAMIHLTK